MPLQTEAVQKMDSELILYIGIMLAGVFISSVAQVLLKKAAERRYDSLWQQYINPAVIIAYVIFFCATFMSIYAYKRVPLSMGAILEATGYIYITLFSVKIFHEKINKRKLLALVLIITGITVYSVWG
jgi:multidrug transporter EmrE-like cation transporter